MSDDQSRWPRAIYSTEQVRGFDRYAIDRLGIDGFDLMQRAALASLKFCQRQWPRLSSLQVFCGAGNNAGDGYVLAALAAGAGLSARVVAVVDPAGLDGEAALAYAMAREAGIEISGFESPLAGPGADLVVDALLGTGLARNVGGDLAAAVASINSAGCPVLALDIPTGIDSDTGEVRGLAVKADATITFVGLKTGLYLGQAPNYRGRLEFSDLGLPDEVYRDAVPRLRRLDASAVAGQLSPRDRMAHKGSNGRVLVVGGSAGMPGAARLAAEGALRAGAGLVYAAVHRDSVGPVLAGRPEIICRGVEHPDEIAELAHRVDVIVVGPGLGRDEWGESMAEAMLAVDRPVVVDADALNFLAGRNAGQGITHGRRVLTPHPAEAARLLGETVDQVQAARDRAVTALAARFGAVAVLKGACSLIAEQTDSEDVLTDICDYGNPGMATGGTGDVLAGVIAALIAQLGFSRQSVALGVLVHALAGDDAAADGERGLVASDLLPHIRRRVNPH